MGLALAGLLLASAPLVLAGEVEVSDNALVNRALDEVAEAIRLRSNEAARVGPGRGARCAPGDSDRVIVGLVEAVASLQLTLERCGGPRTALVLRLDASGWSTELAEAAAQLYPERVLPNETGRDLSRPPAAHTGGGSRVTGIALVMGGVGLSAAAGAIAFALWHASEQAVLSEERAWSLEAYRDEMDPLPGILAPTLIGLALASATFGVVLYFSSEP